MQRLNIQLSRHIQTTRRPRWVVWILAILLVFTGCFVYWTTTLWLTRDTIYEAAPENTAAAVRFFVGGSNQGRISSILQNIPLISNRAIVFQDIRPYVNGEFVVFVEKDGTRSIALRVGSPLPQAFLDSQHIIQKQVTKDITLLSERPEQTRKLNISSKFLLPIPFPGKRWIGEIAFEDEKKRGWIFDEKSSVILSLPEKYPRSAFPGVPDKTMAFISTTPAASTAKSALLAPFLPLIGSIVGSDAKTYLNQLSSKINTVFVTKDDNGVGFFLRAQPPDSDKTLDVRKLLQSISALNSPKVQKTDLLDGTFIRELVSDPDSVSVEQVTVLGMSLYRVQMNPSTLLAGFTDEKHLILTNREDLLRFYKESSTHKKKQTICGANTLGISLDLLTDLSKSHANFMQSNAFEQINERFSSIGVVNGLFSTDINICKR